MIKKLFASVGIAAVTSLVFAAPSLALSVQVDDVPENLITLDAHNITRDFVVDAGGNVTNLTISVDFMKHDIEDCLVAPEGYASYPDEIGMALESPSGTIVNLVKPWGDEADGTYPDWQAVPSLVRVTFDDSADELVGLANDGAPVSGVFKPVEPLSEFLGEAAQGVWKLHVQDTYEWDATCYYGASLNIETDYREPTTTTLTSTSSEVAIDEEFILSAVVSPEAEGFVEFTSNGVLLGTAPVEMGLAAIIFSFDEVGEFEIVAEYLGNEGFEGSLSDTIIITATEAAGEEPGEEEVSQEEETPGETVKPDETPGETVKPDETPAKTDPVVAPEKEQIANTGGSATGLILGGSAALLSGAALLLLRRRNLEIS